MGWLLDMKTRTAEEYKKIIQEQQAVDYDDRDVVRQSSNFKSLQAGSIEQATSSLSIDTNVKKQIDARTSPSKSTAVSPSHTPFATEIRNLRADIVKLQDDVKKEKTIVCNELQKNNYQHKEYIEAHIGIEELALFKRLEVSGFNAVYNFIGNFANAAPGEAITLELQPELFHCINEETLVTSRTVAYNRVARVC